MYTANCIKTTWDGREALSMSADRYSATIVPSLGANVISLTYMNESGAVDILRTPPDSETLLDDPYAYGIPVLFPANRVEGGSYRWDGVTYTFPQNYPNGVHIHGVFHGREWPVADYGITNKDASRVRLELDTAKYKDLRKHFPVDILFRLDITLDSHGLTHTFTVINKSSHAFPVGLAYHTAFRVPFCKNITDTRLIIPIDSRCMDDSVNRLPNGKTAGLNDFEARLASLDGGDPMEMALDYLYTAKENTCEALLRSRQAGCEVVYQAGKENHYWILWNKTTKESFIAIEPQTWLSNAMNMPNPQENHAIFVKPHTEWSGTARIFVRSLKDKE